MPVVTNNAKGDELKPEKKSTIKPGTKLDSPDERKG